MKYTKLNFDAIDDIMSRAIQREKLLKHIRDNLSYEAAARDYGIAPTSVNRIVNGINHSSITVHRRAELNALRVASGKMVASESDGRIFRRVK